MAAHKVSPVDGGASASQLARVPREIRSGRLLAVCHIQPPHPPASATSQRPRRVAFLFHGVGGCCEVFRNQVPVLLRLGYEVVVYDMLGHGQSGSSSRQEDFTFSELRLDALQIFDDLAAPDGGNVLIGHSYGTSFVTYLCHERPRLVSFAINMSGGGPDPLGAESCSIFSCCTCFFICAGPVLRRHLRSRFFRPGAPQSKTDCRLAFNIGAREFKMVMDGQVWPEGDESYHAKICTPTLLLYGEFDSLVSLEDQKYMRQVLGGPGCLVTVPEAGHMLMLEQPDAINSHLAEFLTSSASSLAGVAKGVAVSNSSGSQQQMQQPQLRTRRKHHYLEVPAVRFAAVVVSPRISEVKRHSS